MKTNDVKSKIADGAGRVERVVAAAGASLGNGAEAIADSAERADQTMNDLGTRLLQRAKDLGEAAGRQAHLRPYAVFGVAFIAGVIFARALRR